MGARCSGGLGRAGSQAAAQLELGAAGHAADVGAVLVAAVAVGQQRRQLGAESRLAEGAGSPARMAILSNAWELLKRNPLTGVGWE